MKATVTKKDLKKALTSMKKVVRKNSPLPILTHTRIFPSPGMITLEGSNLQEWVRLEVPAQLDQADLSPSAPNLELLGKILEALPGEVLTLEGDAESFAVTGGGKTFQVPCADAREFPLFAEVGKNPETIMRVPANEARDMVSRVLPATAKGDDSRPVLTGMLLLNTDGLLTLVGTDGRRLARESYKWGRGTSGKAVVSRTSLEVLADLLKGRQGTLEVLAGEQYASFQALGMLFVARTLLGLFPDFHRVIPKEEGGSLMRTSKKILEGILDRMVAVTPKPCKGQDPARLVFQAAPEGWGMTVTVTSPEFGEVREEVPGTFEGEALTLGFDTVLLRDGVRACPGDEVEIRFQGKGNAILLQPTCATPYQYVLMPCRL